VRDVYQILRFKSTFYLNFAHKLLSLKFVVKLLQCPLHAARCPKFQVLVASLSENNHIIQATAVLRYDGFQLTTESWIVTVWQDETDQVLIRRFSAL
jgi:hypothetical protein